LIAKQIDLSETDCFKLNIAAILHDVGILLVPQQIVIKPGKLNEDENKIIKKHPIYGYNLTRDLDYGVPDLNNVDDIIRHHHERYDGTGYPDGLKGDRRTVTCLGRVRRWLPLTFSTPEAVFSKPTDRWTTI
jgi:HD-GYP domain-containing protein (c-di-GMP phosphodiesterase class II)